MTHTTTTTHDDKKRPLRGILTSEDATVRALEALAVNRALAKLKDRAPLSAALVARSLGIRPDAKPGQAGLILPADIRFRSILKPEADARGALAEAWGLEGPGTPRAGPHAKPYLPSEAPSMRGHLGPVAAGERAPPDRLMAGDLPAWMKRLTCVPCRTLILKETARCEACGPEGSCQAHKGLKCVKHAKPSRMAVARKAFSETRSTARAAMKLLDGFGEAKGLYPPRQGLLDANLAPGQEVLFRTQKRPVDVQKAREVHGALAAPKIAEAVAPIKREAKRAGNARRRDKGRRWFCPVCQARTGALCGHFPG